MTELRILKRPLMSEKNALLAESGTYVFEVNIDTDKVEIKKALEEAFSVQVKSIRTAIGRGRKKRTKFGYGKAKYFKKAFVRLADGQKIGLFEGV